MRLWLALALLSLQPTASARVVVTFAASTHPLQQQQPFANATVVKQYGRRLVLALSPPERDALTRGELDELAAMGEVVEVEVRFGSPPHWLPTWLPTLD